MKLGHMILRKIFKFVAIGCEILRLKCTKFNSGRGELTALPRDLLAGFKGPTFKEVRERDLD